MTTPRLKNLGIYHRDYMAHAAHLATVYRMPAGACPATEGLIGAIDSLLAALHSVDQYVETEWVHGVTNLYIETCRYNEMVQDLGCADVFSVGIYSTAVGIRSRLRDARHYAHEGYALDVSRIIPVGISMSACESIAELWGFNFGVEVRAEVSRRVDERKPTALSLQTNVRWAKAIIRHRIEGITP